MYITRDGKTSKRCQEDYCDILDDKVCYELKLAALLHEFDVSQWYDPTMDYVVPCKFFSTLEEYLNGSNNEYVFVRHDSVSAKDVLDITVFERSKEGYEYMKYISSRSPRIQEAIRLNSLIGINDSKYVLRDIIPIDAEYRVLIVDGLTKWIIPDYLERGTEHHDIIKSVVRKFKINYKRDNYAIDVVISEDKALILELNPLLYGILDVSPYENIINLKELNGNGNVL